MLQQLTMAATTDDSRPILDKPSSNVKIDKMAVAFDEQFMELVAVIEVVISSKVKSDIIPDPDVGVVIEGINQWKHFYNKLKPTQRYTGCMYLFEPALLDNESGVFSTRNNGQWLAAADVSITHPKKESMTIPLSKIYSWAVARADEVGSTYVPIGDDTTKPPEMVYPLILLYRLYRIFNEILHRPDRFTVKSIRDPETGKLVKQPPTKDEEARLGYINSLKIVLDNIGVQLYQIIPEPESAVIANVWDEIERKYAPKSSGGGLGPFGNILGMASPLFDKMGMEMPDMSDGIPGEDMAGIDTAVGSLLGNDKMIDSIQGLFGQLEGCDGDIRSVSQVLRDGLAGGGIIDTILETVAETGDAAINSANDQNAGSSDNLLDDAMKVAREKGIIDDREAGSSSTNVTSNTSDDKSSVEAKDATVVTSTNDEEVEFDFDDEEVEFDLDE